MQSVLATCFGATLQASPPMNMGCAATHGSGLLWVLRTIGITNRIYFLYD